MRATKLPYVEYVFYFMETEAVVPDELCPVGIKSPAEAGQGLSWNSR
jgi:hypothetical protein